MLCEKRYILFAGINGAGKTDLFHLLRQDFDFGRRISVDDIAARLGDWRDNLVQIKAARRAMSALREAIEQGVTFHQETTLPGEAILRFVDLARAGGYRIVLYYIGLSSLAIAKDRVRRRVAAGGHGVDERVMEKRYADMKHILRPLAARCDEVYFFDNTTCFRQIGVFVNGRCVTLSGDTPDWLRALAD